jgi:uncharacterized caspase-like protein
MKQILILFAIALFVSGCLPPRLPPPPPPCSGPECPITSCTRIMSPRGEPSPPCRDQYGDAKSLQKALVIGNGEYKSSPLSGPLNDAEDMTKVLRDMGFYVTRAKNLDFQTMNKVVNEFTEELSGLSDTTQGVAFFYFSGHGARTKGTNFLIPTDNDKIEREKDLEKNALSVQTLLAKMEEVNLGVNLLVLDACNNNPYPSKEKSVSTRGLAPITPKGSLVAFAASPEQVAIDTDGNGLYTKSLLNAINHLKHERIEDVLITTAKLVAETSQDAQQPWYQSTLRKMFCFGGCKATSK